MWNQQSLDPFVLNDEDHKMRLIKFAASFAALAVMAVTSSVHAQVELGVNNGFESAFGPGDPFDPANPQNWFVFDNGGNTGGGQATTDPFADASHAEIFINGDGGSFAGLQQRIDAVAGETYSFSFFAQDAPGTFDVGIEYRIEWRRADGSEISRDQLTATTFGPDYTQFTVSGVAPTDTAALNAVIALQSFQGGTTGTANIDSTSVLGPAAVPEPSSIALLGLATCGLVARRRRS